MSFAIFRTAKISTMGNLRASAEHNFRERVTLNADAKRTHLNSTSGAGSSAEVLASAKKIFFKIYTPIGVPWRCAIKR